MSRDHTNDVVAKSFLGSTSVRVTFSSSLVDRLSHDYALMPAVTLSLGIAESESGFYRVRISI